MSRPDPRKLDVDAERLAKIMADVDPAADRELMLAFLEGRVDLTPEVGRAIARCALMIMQHALELGEDPRRLFREMT